MEGIAGEHRPSVVVGEGDPARRGLLRFVLEGEGLDVVGEADTTVQLVQVLAVHRPDAVVLDDAIGTTAVVVAREMHPQAKVILVWPADVIPIGGDARVDPADVLRELGPAVGRALGLDEPAAATAAVLTLPAVASPAEVDALRERDGTGRLARVLPGPGLPRPTRDEPVIVDREPAPLLILPLAPAPDDEA
ncbi:MAG TPA: hypothetical protein VIB62_09840 [Actinomycetota bacterium]|jgi:hypothetical protein